MTRNRVVAVTALVVGVVLLVAGVVSSRLQVECFAAATVAFAASAIWARRSA